MKINNCLKHNQRGFTLVEILITIFLFSLLALIGIGTFVTTHNFNKKINNIRLVQEETTNIAEYIQREVNLSDHLVVQDKILQIFTLDPDTGEDRVKIIQPSADWLNLTLAIQDGLGNVIQNAANLNSEMVQLSYNNLHFTPATSPDSSNFVNMQIEYTENKNRVVPDVAGKEPYYMIITTATTTSM
jgi:prepilin-type N-terminal cleavage/methylation domain-containing protein